MSDLSSKIGELISVTNREMANGNYVVEYIQGKIVAADESTVTIHQYIPFIEHIRGNKPQCVSRQLPLNNLSDIKIF